MDLQCPIEKGSISQLARHMKEFLVFLTYLPFLRNYTFRAVFPGYVRHTKRSICKLPLRVSAVGKPRCFTQTENRSKPGCGVFQRRQQKQLACTIRGRKSAPTYIPVHPFTADPAELSSNITSRAQLVITLSFLYGCRLPFPFRYAELFLHISHECH